MTINKSIIFNLLGVIFVSIEKEKTVRAVDIFGRYQIITIFSDIKYVSHWISKNNIYDKHFHILVNVQLYFL